MFCVAHTFLTHAESDTITPFEVEFPKSLHDHMITPMVARLVRHPFDREAEDQQPGLPSATEGGVRIRRKPWI
jgi:hypothetical protein